jgi:hypothetical protein
LTRRLPKRVAQAMTNTWAMRLRSGAFCSMGTGTVMPGFPFYCSDGGVCSTPARKAAGTYIAQCGLAQQMKVVKRRSASVATMWR